MTVDQARRAALALPGAAEQDHHGRPSFRVAGKIFATLWDERHMNVMLDEPGIRTAVEADPEVCSEVWWGRKLSAVRVDLERVGPGLLAELLGDAWERKAQAGGAGASAGGGAGAAAGGEAAAAAGAGAGT